MYQDVTFRFKGVPKSHIAMSQATERFPAYPNPDPRIKRSWSPCRITASRRHLNRDRQVKIEHATRSCQRLANMFSLLFADFSLVVFAHLCIIIGEASLHFSFLAQHWDMLGMKVHNDAMIMLICEYSVVTLATFATRKGKQRAPRHRQRRAGSAQERKRACFAEAASGQPAS